jgi:hypothetical protein
MLENANIFQCFFLVKCESVLGPCEYVNLAFVLTAVAIGLFGAGNFVD